MISALFRAIAQLPDPPIAKVIWLSVIATLLGFAALVFGAAGVLHAAHLTGIPWLDPVVDALGGIAMLGLAYLLFPAVLPAVSSLFLDAVAAAVERRHYPGLPPARPQPFREVLLGALKFLAVSIALNLAALPFYLIPGMNLVLFLALNGYLLGREFVEQVGVRHMDLAALSALRRRHRPRVFMAGILICAIGAIPVLNLLGPVIASAFMVHVFHRLLRD